jgi:hypothetical protein
MTPAKVPIIVSAGYDPNDETMRLCRENWRQYASRHKNIQFICNRMDSSLDTGILRVVGDDLHVGMAQILGYGSAERAYQDWGAHEWEVGHLRGRYVIDYILKTTPKPFWFVHTNITGFVCFKRLQVLLDHLSCGSIYGGLPIYFQPENFVYIAGSHIIFSSDYFQLLLDDMPKQSFEATDITWGRPFRKLPKLMLPIGNFLSNDFPNETRLTSKTQLALDYIDSGHFFFRYKNYYDGIPREHIDPFIQNFTMLACEAIDVNRDRTLSLVREFGLKVLRGEGVAAVTIQRRSS